MSRKQVRSVGINVSVRIYKVLLNAYPSEFRREYGVGMTQVFRDRYRHEARQPRLFAIMRYWLSTFEDLVITATKEHSDNFGKDRHSMNNMRRDVIAVIGTIAIIVVAFFLHSLIRTRVLPPVFLIGFVLDAVITAGVIGNLIAFLLVKFTRWNSLRIALWTFLVVHAVLLSIIAIMGPKVESQFTIGPALFAYVLSFVFWFGLHWLWHLSSRSELAKS